MNWFQSLRLKTAQTQSLLPYVEHNIHDYTHLKETKEPDGDGNYHCCYCNAVIPNPEQPVLVDSLFPGGSKTGYQTQHERPWKETGKQSFTQTATPEQYNYLEMLLNNIIQSCLHTLSAYGPDSDLDYNVMYNISQTFNYQGFPVKDSELVGHDSSTSSTPQSLMTTIQSPAFKNMMIQKKMKSIKMTGDKFKPVCDACYPEHITTCKQCDKPMFDAEQGIEYCNDCGITCPGCDEWISADDSYGDDRTDSNYCESCYESILEERRKNKKLSIEQLQEDFTEDHPDLPPDTLEQASNESKMEPDAYIAIFDDLPWASNYGGSRWGRIAETWKELIPYKKIENIIADTNKVMVLLDHAFDLAHNTGSLYTKAPDHIKSWLLDALNKKRDFPPAAWYNRISPEIKKFLKEYHQYKITGPGAKEDFDSMERSLGNENSSIKMNGVDQLIKYFDNDYISSLQVGEFINKYDLRSEDFKATPLAPIAKLLTITNNNAPVWSDFAVSSGKILVSDKGFYDAKPLYSLSVVRPEEVLQRVGTENYNSLVSSLANKIFPEADPIKFEEFITKDIPSYLNPSQINNSRSWARAITDSKKRQKAARNNHRIIKLAALTQNTFFDFYAMTMIDCNQFPADKRNYCHYMKAWTIHQIIVDLVQIFERACVREARHVNDQLMSDD